MSSNDDMQMQLRQSRPIIMVLWYCLGQQHVDHIRWDPLTGLGLHVTKNKLKKISCKSFFWFGPSKFQCHL